MKFAYAAAMAASTALLCLGTPAQAKCGDSGNCNHGRIYVKTIKAKTAISTTTTRSTRAIAQNPRKQRRFIGLSAKPRRFKELRKQRRSERRGTTVNPSGRSQDRPHPQGEHHPDGVALPDREEGGEPKDREHEPRRAVDPP